MNNNNLKMLLLEYEKKRNMEIANAFKIKSDIYFKYPRLQEIDDELSKYAISAAKVALTSNSNSAFSIFKDKKNTLKNEKINILKKYGISESSFLPKYECNLCNDTGYISHNYKTQMCPCLKQKLFDLEYNTFNTYNMKNQTFDLFKYENYSDKVDQSKYNSNISPRKNIQIIRNLCDKFISGFDDPSEKNMLFFGNSGLGKTFLSSCVANELLKKNKTVLYQTAPIMLDSVIDYRLR